MNRCVFRLAWILLIWASSAAGFLAAQDELPFTFTLSPQVVTVERGGKQHLTLTFTAPEGYYFYADMFSVKAAGPGLTFDKPAVPKPHKKYDPTLEMEKEVFTGTNEVRLDFTASKTAPAAGEITVTVDYQGCAPTMCYLPVTRTLTAGYKVTGHAQPDMGPLQSIPIKPEVKSSSSTSPAFSTAHVSPDVSPAAPPPSPAATTPVPNTPSTPTSSSPQTSASVPSKTNYYSAWAFLALFGMGILTSFTPCVWPLIPITVAIFGATGAKTKLKAFLLSLAYVQGICLMYAALGLIATLSGSIFGQQMSNPWVMGVIALIFICLGLFMAGVFNLNLPSTLQNKASAIGGKGFFGAFGMGMVSGVIAAPCTGPALAGVLLWVSTANNIPMGIALLYVYALGLGLPFLILGTSSALISKIPKSGHWMETIKGIFAAVMFTAAFYFLRNVFKVLNLDWIGRETLFILAGFAMLLAGFFLKGLRVDFHGASVNDSLKKILSLLIITAGACAIVAGLAGSPIPNQVPGSGSGQTIQGLNWQYDLEATLARAKQEGKPVMIDFYADWCAACKELDKYTWTDAKVQKALDSYVLVKVDMTRPRPDDAQLKSTYGIVGLPVVAFHGRDGALLAEPRLRGFVKPAEFLELVKQVK